MYTEYVEYIYICRILEYRPPQKRLYFTRAPQTNINDPLLYTEFFGHSYIGVWWGYPLGPNGKCSARGVSVCERARESRNQHRFVHTEGRGYDLVFFFFCAGPRSATVGGCLARNRHLHQIRRTVVQNDESEQPNLSDIQF